MNYKFGLQSRTKQVKENINDNPSTNKVVDVAERQENQILTPNETQDDLEDFNLPEDNLGAMVEETKAEEKVTIEDVKLRVEDVKPARELKDIIPFSNSHVIKDVARNPFVARVVLYLEEHGYSAFTELSEALGISVGSLWFTFDKLKKIDFPVVQISKHEAFNKRVTHYDLRRTGGQEDELKKMLKELRVWYEYYSLKAFLKVLPEFKWVSLEELSSSYNFRNVIKKYGFDFDRAIQLLLKNGVVRVKGQGENFTHIKRLFDNYGARISEIEGKDLVIDARYS